MSTWELIIEPKSPIPINELELVIKEGDALQFPLHRSYENNLINDYWNKFIVDMALRKKDNLENSNKEEHFIRAIKHIASISSMYRLNNASLNKNQLKLRLGLTDFKEYIGTTQEALINNSFRKKLINAGTEDHNDPNYYFANPLAVCTNIITSDNKIPIGMRSNTVAIYKNVPHIIGGYVKVNGENKPDFSVKDVNLFDNILKELEQELGLNQEHIISSDFLGLVRNNITRGPEMIYNMTLNITSEELIYSWKHNSEDRFEHRDINFYDKNELPKFININKGKMVPSGEAALTLFLEKYP